MRITKKQIQINSIVLGTLLIVGLVVPHILPIHAGDGPIDYIASLLAYVLLLIVGFFGEFLTVLSDLLVTVAQYNKFGSASFVISAWVIVRDFANIFFIVALLIIAVATILRIEVYSAKRLLFKLVLMAVLINFSRSIAIFIINIAQVIMLFFVKAFAGVQGLLLTNILLLNQYLSLVEDQDQLANFDLSGLIGNILLAGAFIAIGTFVVGTIIILLAFRIVMLWLLIILSPLAFLLHAFPGGTTYAGQWWGTFAKNVISGPVMAFFLWLAFFAVQPVSQNGNTLSVAAQFFEADADGFLDVAGNTANAAAISSPDNLLSFIVGIGLLIGGLILTSQIGGAGASFASAQVGRIQRAGTASARGTGRAALGAARGVGYSKYGGRTIPRAMALRDQMSQSKTMAWATKEGRERNKLRSTAVAQMGRAGGSQSYPKAAKDLEKRLKESGELEEHSTRKRLREDDKSPVNQLVGLKSSLERGDAGATDDLDKFIDPATANENELRRRLDLEAVAEKENKQYVGKVTIGDDGLRPKTEDEMYEDRVKKANNQKTQEIQKSSVVLKADSKKEYEDERAAKVANPKDDSYERKIEEQAHKNLAYNPDGSNLNYNIPALKDQAQSIAALIEKHGDALKPEIKVKLRAQHEKLSANLRTASKGKERVDRIKSRGTTEGNISSAMDRIPVNATRLKQPTSSLYQGARGVQSGNVNALSGKRDDLDRIFDAYTTNASQSSSGIAKSDGGTYSYSQLAQERRAKATDNYDTYELAVADYNAAETKLDAGRAEGNDEAANEALKEMDTAEKAVNDAVAGLESEIANIATPDFVKKQQDLESGDKQKNIKEFKQAVTDNRKTIVNISTEEDITTKDRDTQMRDILNDLPDNIDALAGPIEDTIGLNTDQASLKQEITDMVDALQKQKTQVGEISKNDVKLLADTIKKFEDNFS